MDRNEARQLINTICSYDIHTQFRMDGNMSIGTRGTMHHEVRQIIQAHQTLLKWYLSTPPEQSGQCVHGHEIDWQLSKNGTWLCACYFGPYRQPSTNQEHATPPDSNKLSRFWLGDHNHTTIKEN